MSENIGRAFSNLVEIIQALRHPVTGCPWDLEQTHESIRPYLVEEAYEVLEAIDAKDDAELQSELGDLLLQVVLHSQIALDRSSFSIADVVASISEKMIRRHPHVFGEAKVGGSAEVLRNWEKIKYRERQNKDASANGTKTISRLAGVPKALPALIRAQRLGEKAAKVSFDWSNVEGVWAKVREELSELEVEMNRPEITPQRQAALAHELGDVLFSLCQLARWLKLSGEDTLRQCCERFTSRFEEMEREMDTPLDRLSEQELEAAWQKAKTRLGCEKKGES